MSSSIKKAIGWSMLIPAGAAFHFAVEDIWKALAIVVGALVMDIGVDMALLDFLKARGDEE